MTPANMAAACCCSGGTGGGPGFETCPELFAKCIAPSIAATTWRIDWSGTGTPPESSLGVRFDQAVWSIGALTTVLQSGPFSDPSIPPGASPADAWRTNTASTIYVAAKLSVSGFNWSEDDFGAWSWASFSASGEAGLIVQCYAPLPTFPDPPSPAIEVLQLRARADAVSDSNGRTVTASRLFCNIAARPDAAVCPTAATWTIPRAQIGGNLWNPDGTHVGGDTYDATLDTIALT